MGKMGNIEMLVKVGVINMLGDGWWLVRVLSGMGGTMEKGDSAYDCWEK